MGARAAGRDLARLLIGEQRLVVAALELPGEADENARPRIAGPKQRHALEGGARPGGPLGGHLGTTQLDPALGVIRLLLGGLAKMTRGLLVRAEVHGPASARYRTAHAAGENDRRREGETGADQEPPWELPLTQTRTPWTMRPMTRDVLSKLLSSAPGVQQTGDTFEVADGHHLTLYVGRPGQAMVVGEVTHGAFEDGILRVTTRPEGTLYWIELDALHGVALEPPAPERERRTGFS